MTKLSASGRRSLPVFILHESSCQLIQRIWKRSNLIFSVNCSAKEDCLVETREFVRVLFQPKRDRHLQLMAKFQPGNAPAEAQTCRRYPPVHMSIPAARDWRGIPFLPTSSARFLLSGSSRSHSQIINGSTKLKMHFCCYSKHASRRHFPPIHSPLKRMPVAPRRHPLF